MQKTLYCYRLTDARGTQTITVVNDPTDNGTIGGFDTKGQYQQYDSYELYHAYAWAEKHGMTLESGQMTVDIADTVFTPAPEVN